VKTKNDPSCDKHTNLQMIPTSFKTPAGRIFGYVCPVPSCGRHCDGESYFYTTEATSTWERKTADGWPGASRNASRNSELEANR